MAGDSGKVLRGVFFLNTLVSMDDLTLGLVCSLHSFAWSVDAGRLEAWQGRLGVFFLKTLVGLDDWTLGRGLLTAFHLLVCRFWMAGDLGKVGSWFALSGP